MNHEIVLELYEIAQEWSYEKYSKKETGYTREYWAAYKLAELIVGECNQAVLEVPAYYTDYRDQIEKAVIHDCSRAIMERFGVE